MASWEYNFKMDRANKLEAQFKNALGDGNDWLGKYRIWLEDNKIVADNYGWPSEQAYDQANIQRFILEMQNAKTDGA